MAVLKACFCYLCHSLSSSPNVHYNNSHKDSPKSGETLGQTRASAAHNSEIVYESRYNDLGVDDDACRLYFKVFQQAPSDVGKAAPKCSGSRAEVPDFCRFHFS
jgi:hypothetical protein